MTWTSLPEMVEEAAEVLAQRLPKRIQVSV